MAKNGRKEKEKGAWDRCKLWIDRNEKVIMVVLLLLLAPFFAFTGPVYQYFSPTPGQGVSAVVYGKKVTGAEVVRVGQLLQAVARIAPDPLYAARLSLGDLNPLNFLAYKDKALSLGIRVTDDELKDRIHNIWRAQKAMEYGQAEAAKGVNPNDQSAFYQRYFEAQRLAKEKEKELRDANAFVKEEWINRVAQSGVRLSEFEAMLRDMYLVAKLESYVTSSVQVTPEEVYKEYRNEDQKRKLSWVEAKPSDFLKEKIAPGVKEDSLDGYYQANIDKKPFQRELALRATYLLVPRDHFEAEAEKALTDEELKGYYDEHRNEYRRPKIRSDETEFRLWTPEEKAALEADIFFPLDEVKEKVRKKVLEERTQRDLVTFAAQMRTRLFPAKAAPVANAAEKKPAATPEELAREFPFLKTGSTEFAPTDKAEEVFGEAYSAGIVRGWFTRAARETASGKSARIDPPDTAQETEKGKGKVFYTRVETRSPGTWRFKEIHDKVKEEYVAEEALKLLAQALDRASVLINKKEGEEGKKDLSSFAVSDLEVELPGGEKTSVKTGAVETTSSYVSKDSRRGGQVKVWKSKQKEEDKAGEKKENAPADSEELEESAHPDSEAILKAGFSLDEKGKAAAARGEAEKACYLVSFDEVAYPDPAGFDKRREELANKLLQEKKDKYFNNWRQEFFKEAFEGGGQPQEPKEVAQAPGK